MSLTCLIAAHDPWFIQLLRIYSEESGFRVAQVYEGQDVLPMIYQEKPVAVFLQADLPGKIKSWEVLHSIKTDSETSNIPVLVFSYLAHMLDDDPAIWMEGASAHLQEPVTYEIFQDALKKVGVCLVEPNSVEQPSSGVGPKESPYSVNGKAG